MTANDVLIAGAARTPMGGLLAHSAVLVAPNWALWPLKPPSSAPV